MEYSEEYMASVHKKADDLIKQEAMYRCHLERFCTACGITVKEYFEHLRGQLEEFNIFAKDYQRSMDYINEQLNEHLKNSQI